MKLLRVATATFTPDPGIQKSWEIEFGNCRISTREVSPQDPESWRVLLIAETQIDFPEINDDGYIALPEDSRRELEFCLETIANFISVTGQCRRVVSSATPSAALIPEDPGERERLQQSRGFYTQQKSIVSASGASKLDSELMKSLSDRWPALALLAEAKSHSLSAGKFHEYVRLFESAFALQFSQLTKKLRQFLNPVYGYTTDEIASWSSIRDPLTHADGKKSNFIFLDADARQYTQRMEQAAYDVLFNKLKWHDRSSERRQVWTPIAATTSADGNIIVKQGSAPKISMQVIDEFGIFPKDLNAILTAPPDDWWAKFEAPE